MRKTWAIKWHWFKNYTNSQAKINPLENLFVIFLISLFIFLVYNENNKLLFGFLLSILILIQMFNFKSLSLGVLLGCLLIFSKEISNLLICKYLNTEIASEYIVQAAFQNGFIINHNNINIYICNKNNKYVVNSLVYINGIINKLANSNSFYKSNNVYLCIYNAEIKLIKMLDSNVLFSNYQENAKIYLNLIFFSKKIDKSKFVLMTLQQLNISHFFTISGFHFGILYYILCFIFNKIPKIKQANNWISIVLLFVYLMVLKFQISATRAFLVILLIQINKKYWNNRLSELNILSVIAFIFILWNPNVIYKLGFIYSFTLTGIIFIFRKKLNSIKKEWLKNILIINLVYLSSIIISIAINNEISIFGFFYQMVFTPIFYFSYLFSIVFFWNKYLMNSYFNLLNNILLFLNSMNYLISITKKAYEIGFIYHMLIIITKFSLDQKEIYKKYVFKNYHLLKVH